MRETASDVRRRDASEETYKSYDDEIAGPGNDADEVVSRVYLTTNGMSPMNRARLIAFASERWCAAVRFVRLRGIMRP